MKIALDYDGTYTEDKGTWNLFLLAAMGGGAQVVCCTNRSEDSKNADLKQDMGFHNIPIVYAAKFKDKWQAMSMSGYQPSEFIWIDDNPMLIKKSK